MAITEACKFQIREYVDHYVKKEGLTRNQASKELAKWFKDNVGIEIKPETIRQKDYRARVVTNVTTPVKVPMCIRCEVKPAIRSLKTGKPMKHGLCRKCKINGNGNHNARCPKKVFKKAQSEFEKISIDTKAEKYWSNVAAKIERLFETPVIGKVGVDVLRKVKSAHDLMSSYVGLMEQESTP